MPWVKAFHLIAMVTWFSGIFYLPRLFVYHAMSADKISQERFKVMERKLYFGIMLPGAIMTVGSGVFGLYHYAWALHKHTLWLPAKLFLVFLLILYHLYCGYLRRQFARDQNRHSHVFYRWLNEVPVLLLISIIGLAVFKPC